MWKDLPEGHTLRNISDLMFQERDDPTWRHVYLEQSTHAELQKTSGYFGIRMVRSLQIRMKNWNIYRPTYEYELSYCLRNGQKWNVNWFNFCWRLRFKRNYRKRGKDLFEPFIFNKHFYLYFFKKACTISEFILGHCQTYRASHEWLTDKSTTLPTSRNLTGKMQRRDVARPGYQSAHFFLWEWYI